MTLEERIGQIVSVCWIDATSLSGWQDSNEVANLVPLTVRTIGHALRTSAQGLVIGHSIATDAEDCCTQYIGVMTIPIGGIQSIQTLTVVEDNAN